MFFKDRVDAGKKLSQLLVKYKNVENCMILGLPRGGVVVAYEIAKNLNLPLDVIVVKKLGAPFNEELAIGAIAEEGTVFLNEKLINEFDISKEYIDQIKGVKQKEVERRVQLFRGESLDLENKIAIIVDDGIATGATVLAAIKCAKDKRAKKVVVAMPVLPSEFVSQLNKLADEVVYLFAPQYFAAVGDFYESFIQVEDEEVLNLIRRSKN
ncbi:TPA: phosphoribosyltransferase [Candidatus Dependentiae bacterium]|nr:MAG: Phosphoribosyltransferase [candidate division TM6 bacterium GW2011_GWE2_31_21]KKP53856.1 MAG: Phosphoribosyltransferase [candidate division TM6 bacterium GW2011_GWF2_33_332]HBS47636.1 phosphoribosyltransferase [Candidatus Dependentiae bacterium]HBZ73785.1 phosphoribosyltransferase [Candidatus Dependentiae bacterium]